jgi:hypothetical protein
MKDIRISLPELALIAGTRAALGVRVGLLAARYLSDDQRRSVGWTLVSFGALCTVPLAFQILGGGSVDASGAWAGHPEEEWRPAPPDRPRPRNSPAAYYPDMLR